MTSGVRTWWRRTALCLVVLAAACNPQQFAERTGGVNRLSIATGGTGGVFYPYGGGIAKIITEYVPGVEVTAEVTAASVDNLKFLRDGQADLVFTTGDTLADAVNGTDAFAGSPVPVRSLAVLYSNYTQIVTMASSGIRDFGDLRGHVVSTGAAGSGTEITAFRLLTAAGIDPATDLSKQSLGVAQSVDALRDGKIDAFFWSGGLPTASILDLAHTSGVTIRMIPSESLLPALQQTYGAGLYVLGTIPGGTYRGVDEDSGVVSVAIVLAVREDMPEALAYDITRVLFAHQSELAAIHPEAGNLTLESAVQGSPAPFHPGAIRNYQEARVWPQ